MTGDAKSPDIAAIIRAFAMESTLNEFSVCASGGLLLRLDATKRIVKELSELMNNRGASAGHHLTKAHHNNLYLFSKESSNK